MVIPKEILITRRKSSRKVGMGIIIIAMIATTRNATPIFKYLLV
jgi:hypothetical protein